MHPDGHGHLAGNGELFGLEVIDLCFPWQAD